MNYTCTDQNVTGLFTLWDTPLRDAGYQVALLGRVDIPLLLPMTSSMPFLYIFLHLCLMFKDMGGGYGGGFHGTQSGLAIWTRSANITKPTTEGLLSFLSLSLYLFSMLSSFQFHLLFSPLTPLLGPELSDNAKDPYANDDVFINDCVKYLEQYGNVFFLSLPPLLRISSSFRL